MNRPGEVRRRVVVVHLLLHQQRIGAQVHKLLARHDALDDFGHVLVDQRLTTRNRHHRRPALVHGVERVFHAHALLENILGMIDLAATRAGQVALEQRLQHQHQRVFFFTSKLLAHDVTCHAVLLNQRYCHFDLFLGPRAIYATRRVAAKTEQPILAGSTALYIRLISRRAIVAY